MKSRISILLAFTFLSMSMLHSQALTLWSRTYDEASDAMAIIPTSDGGYAATGGLEEPNQPQPILKAFIMKTDGLGQLSWLKVYERGDQSSGTDIIQTSDGGYAVAGASFNYFDVEPFITGHFWLLRMDAAGDTLWTRSVGDASWQEHTSCSVWETEDGGFIIGGYYLTGESAGYLGLVKVNSAGDYLWTRSVPLGTHLESTTARTADNGFIVLTGDTRLIRLDADGQIVWQGVIINNWDWDCLVNDIRETTDGGFIAAGSKIFHSPEESDLWLARLSSSGETLWQQSYSDPAYSAPAIAVHETDDSGFLAAVMVWQDDVYPWLLKTDADGIEEWRHSLGDEGYTGRVGYDFKPVGSQNYILCGSTHVYPSDIWLAKIAAVVTPFQRDSLAVADLYRSCGGANWNNQANWLTAQPLATWYGVTVEGDRVTRIVLENNNVTGDLPTSISSLSSLVELDLSGNQMEELPDLSSLASLTRLDVSMNLLTFEDLEPNAGIQPDFIYAPQASSLVGIPRDTTIWEGDDATLFVPVPGTANQYQWLHNGSEIPGATSNPWILSSVSLADTGVYELRITNTLLPLLTLSSAPIHVSTREYSPMVFVSVTGSDSNTGLTIEDPVKTISHVLTQFDANSLHPLVIQLTDGTYSPSTTYEQFPLQVPSYVTIVGDSREGTILDAEGSGSVIRIINAESVRLENLTLTRGAAYRGGGVHSDRSSDINLINITIRGNRATSFGGGLNFEESTVNLKGLLIKENNSEGHGGGICFRRSSSDCAGVTVARNYAHYYGGGIYYLDCTSTFDVLDKCNIYLNRAGDEGHDLHAPLYNITHQVVVDTFTYLIPPSGVIGDPHKFNLNIEHGFVEPVTADLYVNPQGSDANDGLSISAPLQTIFMASVKMDADSTHPGTIFLGEGIYSKSTNDEWFPLSLRSYVTLSGVSAQTTILDAESQNRVITLSGCDGAAIRNLTIMQGNSETGALRFLYSTVQIENTVIAYCKGETGGGIYAQYSDLTLDHVTLSNNYAPGGGHGLYLWGSDAALANSIVWSPISPMSEKIKLEYGSHLSVEYSNILGGVDGAILYSPCKWVSCTLDWLEGNIDADPLFCKSSHTDFSLASSSPCVAAGQDGSDIGATGVGCETPLDAAAADEITPASYLLVQNHPNPFNPVTTMRYELPEGAVVRLVVYDLQGREVARLTDSYLPAGSYESTWDGRDRDGQALPSGVYIARLVTPQYTKAIKMVLLK